MKKITCILICVLIFSCEKKELPAPKYDRGDIVSSSVSMQSDYRDQVWFSLSENKVASVNRKIDWDIAFECSPEGYHIILNGSKAMRAFKTSESNILNVTDTLGLGAYGKADVPGGNLDSTALDNWINDNKVYVINRGYSETGNHQGFYKLKIHKVSTGSYALEYGNIKETRIFAAEVVKNSQYNFVAFSFSTGKSTNIEPPRSSYDICFTQYTHVFYDPFQYYQVTGVLVNPNGTRVMKLKGRDFSQLALADTIKGTFSNRQDAIGYDWKDFDLDKNLFTVNIKTCFFIQDNKGFYYKLHFVDFYDNKGVKGTPKFEFKKL